MAHARSLALLAVLAASSLTGCNIRHVNLRHEELRPTARFEWLDARPPWQRSSGNESLFIGSCAYGIYALGDDKFTPDRVVVLRSDLDRALGAELSGRKVTLKAYTVHFNTAAGLRRIVSSGNRGLIADLMNDQSVHGCAPDDLRGGFAGHEQTTPNSPLVVVIDVEVDGAQVHARWFENAPEPMESRAIDKQSPVWHDWVSKAIRSATSKAVDGIKAALSADGASSQRPGYPPTGAPRRG